MVCPKCKSENVQVQVINEVKLKEKHHGFLWWLFIGCWWVPTKWFFFTVPALIVKIFSRKKYRTVNKQKRICICQDCGYKWNL